MQVWAILPRSILGFESSEVKEGMTPAFGSFRLHSVPKTSSNCSNNPSFTGHIQETSLMKQKDNSPKLISKQWFQSMLFWLQFRNCGTFRELHVQIDQSQDKASANKNTQDALH